MTNTEFIAALNQKFNGMGYTFSLDKPGAKFTRLVATRSCSRSVYCFLDAAGNIYKAAGWKAPAKGVRSTLATVDMNGVDAFGSWLYIK
jgi:hypothetical protein